MDPARIEEAKIIQGWVKLILGLVLLGSYAAGIGYNLSQLNETERRVGVLENQMQNAVPKDEVNRQYTDLKEQINKMDERFNKIDERLDRMILKSQQPQIQTFSDRKR